MSKPRILLVDDEPSITAAVKVSLRKEPWEVVTAGSGEEGLALLERQPAAVVLSDERMPGMNGADFLAEVAKRWPRTIRLMLSGQPTHEDAMKSTRGAGIWRYFLKPTPAADLRTGIRAALEQHELLREREAVTALPPTPHDAPIAAPAAALRTAPAPAPAGSPAAK